MDFPKCGCERGFAESREFKSCSWPNYVIVADVIMISNAGFVEALRDSSSLFWCGNAEYLLRTTNDCCIELGNLILSRTWPVRVDAVDPEILT